MQGRHNGFVVGCCRDWRLVEGDLVRRSFLSRLIAVHRKRGATVGYEGAKEDV